MILFPAIDLVDGRVVRLQRGDRSRMDVYSDDPAAVARDFTARGAEWIHVVDLSATFEEDEDARAANAAAIRAICEVPGIKVDCGGGVRSIEAVERLADLGVRRIAIGTALVRDPAFAERAAADYGDRVVADVAAMDAAAARVDAWAEAVAAGSKAGPLAAVLEDYFDACLLMNKPVEVVRRDGTIACKGRLAGIDIWGRVTVKLLDGREVEIAPGQASVRAL